ncbi:uncharacterized protein LOC132275438 [Cornus florida]|uniref:uncharacterized protein LOC132275438 n=1 Tax=Cornus florida TaxID=4283 RepID=UPI002897BAD9|nr:uncharacterized protein LOC132275438 [Cornus florida]
MVVPFYGPDPPVWTQCRVCKSYPAHVLSGLLSIGGGKSVGVKILLKFLANYNEDVKSVALKNAPENLKLTSPDIQKDIVNAAAIETISVIISDIGDELFSIMIDESRDISTKEQMAVVFHYVDMDGDVIKHFIGVEHVTSTTALSLKMAIDELFCRHELSITRLHGNDMMELLALVKVTKSHVDITTFFSYVANVVNVVRASCKRCNILHEKQATMVIEALNNGEIESGRGLNQNTTLKRASDTHWGSHYDTLISLISMFSSVIDVLEIIIDDGSYVEQRSEAKILLTLMQSFSFVFTLYLMRAILGVTNELSKALQKKNQDIENAMSLIKVYKKELQIIRESGWDSLLDQVSSFYEKHGIEVPNLNDTLVTPGRSRRKANEITNLHYYHVQFFYAVLDIQLQELNSRFSESNTELLICISCLCPDDSFASFDKEKLIRLAKFYPRDFASLDLLKLGDQLNTYIIDMCSNKEFSNLKGIGDLARRMVKTKRDKAYPLVYLLLKLALILPVATATVERAFSAMNILKTRLRNRMEDEWMNDMMVVYIERDIFSTVNNDVIIQRFQNMKNRRGQL